MKNYLILKTRKKITKKKKTKTQKIVIIKLKIKKFQKMTLLKKITLAQFRKKAQIKTKIYLKVKTITHLKVKSRTYLKAKV